MSGAASSAGAQRAGVMGSFRPRSLPGALAEHLSPRPGGVLRFSSMGMSAWTSVNSWHFRRRRQGRSPWSPAHRRALANNSPVNSWPAATVSSSLPAARTGCRSCARSWAATSTPSPLVPISRFREDRDRLAARIDELGAQVDILVNNAGLGIYTKFGAEGRDKELQMLRVDVEAVVDLMLRYLPGMVERGRGAIINLSSVSGFQPGPYNAGYAAAKAYVLWLSEAVNAEVGRQRCHGNGGLPWSSADGVPGHQRRRLPGQPATGICPGIPRAGRRRRLAGRRPWSRLGGPGRTARAVRVGVLPVRADSIGLAGARANVETLAGVALGIAPSQ